MMSDWLSCDSCDEVRGNWMAAHDHEAGTSHKMNRVHRRLSSLGQHDSCEWCRNVWPCATVLRAEGHERTDAES